MAHYVTQYSTTVLYIINSVIDFRGLTEPKEVDCPIRKLEIIISPVLSNSMEHSLSKKLIVPRRVKEIPRILRNPEVHYPVHISPHLYLS